MTEQEAKTKWCPQAAIVTTMAAVSDRLIVTASDLEKGTHCLASDCMMWRFTEDTYLDKPNYFGYCGLGGRP